MLAKAPPAVRACVLPTGERADDRTLAQAARAALSSERDASLAQTLGQLQPFIQL